jgi:hypothetical protein
MDTLHVALVTHTLYWYNITNFGDYTALLQIVWYVYLKGRQSLSAFMSATGAS